MQVFWLLDDGPGVGKAHNQACKACEKRCPVIDATQGLKKDSTALGTYEKVGVGERINGALWRFSKLISDSSETSTVAQTFQSANP